MVIRVRGRPESIVTYPLQGERGKEIRYRRPEIESFSPKGVIPSEHGCFDRMRITVSGCSLYFDNTQQYSAFRRILAAKNIINRDSTSYKPKIKEEWLFSGEIHFRRDYESAERHQADPHRALVSYRLDLNPSRFLNHLYQKVGRDKTLFSLEYFRTLNLEMLLRKEEISSVQKGLDENDNIIPLDIFKTVRPFEDFLEFYIQSVLRLLRQNIYESMEECIGRPLSEFDITDIDEPTSWSVNVCEVYWEFCVLDSLAFVNGLWAGFQAVLNETEKRMYYSPSVDGQASTGRLQRQNGVAIYAHDFGVQGQTVIVYAKEHNRVRFEVRYNISLLRLFSRRSFDDDLNGMFLAIDSFKDMSARRLRKLIKAMPDLSLSERSEFHILADFLQMMAVTHTKFPHASMRETLSSLINTGRIIVESDSYSDELMQSLARDHIVKTISAELRADRTQKIYFLTPRYSRLLTSMGSVFNVEE